jgi:hypothetical protein
LREAFVGPWDVDAIESVSYRPLWVVLNHARATALGENIFLHRLLLFAALAVFVALIAFCAHQIGLRFGYALFAGCLAIFSKANHANLLWLTDATHAFSGIPVAICCVMRARHVQASRLQPLLVFVLSLFGLLVREDIACLFPLVVLVGMIGDGDASEYLASTWAPRLWSQMPTLLALCASLGIYYLLRKTYVPAAVQGFDPNGMWAHVRMTLTLTGTRTHESVIISFYLFVGMLLGAALFAQDPHGLRPSLLCLLGCTILACTPGLVMARSNLLMVPAALFACALAFALAMALEQCELPLLRVLICAAAVWFCRQTYLETRTSLLAGHPQSIQTVQYAADFLYGDYASRATIPARRRAAAEAYLKRYGITSAESYAAQMPRLLAKAKRRRKPGNKKLFTPPSSFLDH